MTPSAFSRNSRADETGKPVDYTLNATTIELAPYPDTTYSVKLVYYKKPTALSDNTATNEFLENTPDVLLYASLVEAEPYLMNDARIAVWSNLYQQAITNANESSDSAEYSGVPLQIRVAAQ